MSTKTIIHINDIRHSHRLCTIQTEHISKSLAPRSKIFKQNFFFQANYLSLQVTKKQESGRCEVNIMKNNTQNQHRKRSPKRNLLNFDSCTMSSASYPQGVMLAALCTMTYCSPTAHSGTTERIREPSAPVGNEGTKAAFNLVIL